MNVPFLDLRTQYQDIKETIEPMVLDVLESCSYIGGKYVKRFEEEMAEYLGVKYVAGCSNGTDALVLALKACAVKPGDEVITSPFTFFATAEAIASVGAIPVFVDVNDTDYNIDPDKIEDAITDKTKVILPVHIFGAPCDMDRIMEIAEKHDLLVIEDAAQAIGSEYKGKKAGTIGDIGCFSFYPTKNLGGAGDGGMVTTDNDNLYTAIKAYKEHGAGEAGARTIEFQTGIRTNLVLDDQEQELYNPYKYYNYLVGYNSRLDAIQAAVLSVKLKHLDDYNHNRAIIAKKYYDGLTTKVRLPKYDARINPCWHQFVICSDDKRELCSFLTGNGVGNGSFYPVPLHKQIAFGMDNSRTAGLLTVAEKLSRQTVCLPIYPEMTDQQTDYVIKIVNMFYEEKNE